MELLSPTSVLIFSCIPAIRTRRFRSLPPLSRHWGRQQRWWYHYRCPVMIFLLEIVNSSTFSCLPRITYRQLSFLGPFRRRLYLAPCCGMSSSVNVNSTRFVWQTIFVRRTVWHRLVYEAFGLTQHGWQVKCRTTYLTRFSVIHGHIWKTVGLSRLLDCCNERISFWVRRAV